MRIGRRMVAAVAMAAATGTAVVVERRVPASIDVGGDTLIINGFHPVLVGARLINRHGDDVWRPGLRLSEERGSIAHVADNGSVQCRGIGDDIITVSKGDLSKRIVVRCRPITGWAVHGGFTELQFGGTVDLLVGGPGQPYIVGPIGPDRRPVELIQGRATIRDTTIARIDKGLVHPVRVGSTIVDIELSGGAATATYVSVRKAVIDTTVEMVAGQFHTWRVPPGRYEVRLDRDSTSRAAIPMLAPVNANCARGREGPQHYYCTTKENSSFVVSSPTESRKSAGRFSAIQLRQGG